MGSISKDNPNNPSPESMYFTTGKMSGGRKFQVYRAEYCCDFSPPLKKYSEIVYGGERGPYPHQRGRRHSSGSGWSTPQSAPPTLGWVRGRYGSVSDSEGFKSTPPSFFREGNPEEAYYSTYSDRSTPPPCVDRFVPFMEKVPPNRSGVGVARTEKVSPQTDRIEPRLVNRRNSLVLKSNTNNRGEHPVPQNTLPVATGTRVPTQGYVGKPLKINITNTVRKVRRESAPPQLDGRGCQNGLGRSSQRGHPTPPIPEKHPVYEGESSDVFQEEEEGISENSSRPPQEHRETSRQPPVLKGQHEESVTREEPRNHCNDSASASSSPSPTNQTPLSNSNGAMSNTAMPWGTQNGCPGRVAANPTQQGAPNMPCGHNHRISPQENDFSKCNESTSQNPGLSSFNWKNSTQNNNIGSSPDSTEKNDLRGALQGRRGSGRTIPVIEVQYSQDDSDSTHSDQYRADHRSTPGGHLRVGRNIPVVRRTRSSSSGSIEGTLKGNCPQTNKSTPIQSDKKMAGARTRNGQKENNNNTHNDQRVATNGCIGNTQTGAQRFPTKTTQPGAEIKKSRKISAIAQKFETSLNNNNNNEEKALFGAESIVCGSQGNRSTHNTESGVKDTKDKVLTQRGAIPKGNYNEFNGEKGRKEEEMEGRSGEDSHKFKTEMKVRRTWALSVQNVYM